MSKARTVHISNEEWKWKAYKEYVVIFPPKGTIIKGKEYNGSESVHYNKKWKDPVHPSDIVDYVTNWLNK